VAVSGLTGSTRPTSSSHSSLNPRWQPPRYHSTSFGQHIHRNVPVLGPNGFWGSYNRPQQHNPHRCVQDICSRPNHYACCHYPQLLSCNVCEGATLLNLCFLLGGQQ
jgi:hypothetical protein